jgi:hypothetical protein
MSRLNEPGFPRLRNSLLFFTWQATLEARACWRTSSPSGPSSEDYLRTVTFPLSRISEVGRRPLPHDLAVESLMASTLSIGNGSTSVTVAHRKRHGLSWQSQVGVQLAVIPLLVAHRNRPACMNPYALGHMSSTRTLVHSNSFFFSPLGQAH